MKSHARVVIIGGGVMGVGLLYHLALEGWQDIVLVEKGELTSGSTWHAAGQCPHFNGSLNITKVHQYGTELYPKLAALTGYQVSWHGCGGLRLATTEEEAINLVAVCGVGVAGDLISGDNVEFLAGFRVSARMDRSVRHDDRGPRRFKDTRPSARPGAHRGSVTLWDAPAFHRRGLGADAR